MISHTPPKRLTRIHTTDYNHVLANKVFFDTNIWLYLFGPVQSSQPSEYSHYSKIYRDIVALQAKVFTHYIILQEYFHRYISKKMQSYNAVNPMLKVNTIKIFKDTTPIEYQNAINEIKLNFQQILKTSQIDNIDSPSNQEILDMLDSCKPNGPLINDLEIIRICKSQDYLLVTHDGDFQSAPIKIISSNSALCKSKSPFV